MIDSESLLATMEATTGAPTATAAVPNLAPISALKERVNNPISCAIPKDFADTIELIKPGTAATAKGQPVK